MRERVRGWEFFLGRQNPALLAFPKLQTILKISDGEKGDVFFLVISDASLLGPAPEQQRTAVLHVFGQNYTEVPAPSESVRRSPAALPC